MASSTTARSAFLAGTRDGSPFLIVIVPFAGLFGAVATDAGLSVAQTMGFSVLVIAGASQFTAIQLMTEGAPLLLVVAAALAVNLRMMMYSAALVPHLGAASFNRRAALSYLLVDQTYALVAVRYERRPDEPVAVKLAYFVGCAVPVFPLWYLFTWVGAVAGGSLFEAWPIGFAVPITFIALFAPSLKTRAHIAAAGVSGLGAILLRDLPSGTGLLIAAAAAMATGAALEREDAA